MQIDRLFEIIYILLEKQLTTAAALAKRFEVSQRTIYRDVEALSKAGIPIYMTKGKGGGISLLPDFVLNKTVLTKEERDELLSSVRAFSALSLNRQTGLGKLRTLLGENQADWIEVDFSAWGNFGQDAQTFQSLKTAILEKRTVTFVYTGGKAQRLDRTVQPLKLLFKGAAWYLYGFCTLRQDFRFFKLRRISGLVVTNTLFDRQSPDKLITQKLDTGTLLPVKLRIRACMAFRVFDECSVYTVEENGDFLCELYLPGLDIACDYAASFGEFCTILSPSEAVDQMVRRLENSLKNYCAGQAPLSADKQKS